MDSTFIIDIWTVKSKRPMRTGLLLFQNVVGAAISLAVLSAPARAFELYSDESMSVRLDTTLRYSAAVRTSARKVALISDFNADDGNRNFGTGLISNRLDILSEFSLSVGAAGLEVSGAAWYDDIYNRGTDNDSPATYNSSSAAYNHFPDAVEKLHGRDADLLDAYVYAGGEIYDVPVFIRVGRHTLLWGESLFFANNGVAAGQAPIDVIKGIGVPGARAKEVFLPVAQASLRLQPTPRSAAGFYYQFEWRRNRLPGAGSYFSAADFLDAGGERLFVSAGQFLTRHGDQPAPASGQFGAAFQYTGDSYDVGIYALQFNAKSPQIYVRPGASPQDAASFGHPGSGVDLGSRTPRRERPLAYNYSPGAITGSGNPFSEIYPIPTGGSQGEVGTYELVYPRRIQALGVSLSSYLGDSSIAAELSLRRRMPLASRPLFVAADQTADGDSNARYAMGNTLHGQVSTITEFGPNRFWDAAALSGEIAFSYRLNVTRNAQAFDRSRDRFAAALRTVFEPQYFEVLPGLNVSVPVSFGYGVVGEPSIDGAQRAQTGDVEFGLRGTYRSSWIGELSYTHFIGGPGRQVFADRNFLSLSVRYVF